MHPRVASDMDGNGTIEFEEFIRVCTTYCMYTEEDILRCKYTHRVSELPIQRVQCEAI